MSLLTRRAFLGRGHASCWGGRQSRDRAAPRPGPVASETEHPFRPHGQPGIRGVGVYGGGVLRGAATPRIDRLAAEGTRLTNFNVEAQRSGISGLHGMP